VVAACTKDTCPQGTRLTITPAPTDIGAQWKSLCNAGQCTLPPLDPASASPVASWLEFTHSGDFTVVADQPVMLAQYFTGENANPEAAEGDPSLLLTAPVEQWMTSYHLVSSPVFVRNYLSLAARSPQPGIKLDGKDLTAANFPGLQSAVVAGGYVAFRVPVPAGQHNVTAAVPVGVTAYGYDSYVSYGYLAGLSLKAINSLHFGLPEICDNGIDDDGDGKTDCADPKCMNSPMCKPLDCSTCIVDAYCCTIAASCGAGCTCAADAAGGCMPAEMDCGDGTDNDGDGQIDCADSDCASAPGCCLGAGANCGFLYPGTCCAGLVCSDAWVGTCQ
jgi:hypothetical protein